jgi:hypothetical protein
LRAVGVATVDDTLPRSHPIFVPDLRSLRSEEDYAKVKALAAIVNPLRSVFHKTPDDYGMTGWRDIYFPSDDGTPLEGWYIARSSAAGALSAVPLPREATTAHPRRTVLSQFSFEAI